MVVRISTNQSTVYTITDTGNTYIVDANVLIASSTDGLNDTNMASDTTVRVFGSIIGNSMNNGIWSQSANAHFVIEETGMVLGNFGVVLDTTGPADFTNHGYIGGTLSALYFHSLTGTIVNTGEIIGTSVGINFDTSDLRTDFSIENDGLIAGFTAISVYADKSHITLGEDSVVRASSKGISNEFTSTGDISTVVNAGLIITSGGDAYLGGMGSDRITNSGRIIGDVLLGAGKDVFRETGGSVKGQVLGGADNDTYVMVSGKTAIFENAMEGTDTVRSASSYSLAGHGEIEKLLLSGKGDVNATGNEYANIIKGNAGDNKINGGLGADILTGGKGEDTFIFAKGSTNDTITDYVDGIDRIRIVGFDTFHDFGDLKIVKQGADVVIDFATESAADNILVLGALKKDFDSGDFIFA